MGEHPGDEVIAHLAQAVVVVRVVQEVGLAVRVPQAPVDVGAVAGLLGQRLGRQRGHQAVLMGDAAHRLAQPDLVVGGTQRRGVADRQLVLAVAELGVIGVDGDALLLQRRDHVVDDLGARGHRHRGEAAAAVDGVVAARVGGAEQAELVLEGGLNRHAPVRHPRHHALEEAARAGRPGRALERHQVAHHGGALRRVGQHHEALGVGHQAHLAHRPHALDGHQLVEHGEGLHGDGEPDPGLHPLGEAHLVRQLAADDAAVVAIKETNETDVGGVDGRDHLLRVHRQALLRKGRQTAPIFRFRDRGCNHRQVRRGRGATAGRRGPMIAAPERARRRKHG